MIFAVFWIILISVSAGNSGFAFRGLLQRKFKSESLKSPLKSIFDAKASPLSKDFLKDLMEYPFDSTSILNEIEDDLVIDSPDVTHFFFLSHGYRSKSKDLAYMQRALQKMASGEKRRRASYNNTSSLSSSSSSSSSSEEELINETKHDMVVHNAVCNEGKTADGIVNGGDRLVEEIRQVIQAEMTKRYPTEQEEEGSIYDITISLLGNSLGGLYCRYAIAKLVERHCKKEIEDDEDSYWILDEKYRLHFNLFCTTATPHLGVSRYTYLPLPRTAEIGIAHVMRDTGKDLFRLNDLVHKMATCPTFLEPLANFRKRIAYANAYGTDFPVPAGTAAFLSANSSYPHEFDDLVVNQNENRVIAALNTPPNTRISSSSSDAPLQQDPLVVTKSDSETNSEEKEGDEHQDELHRMSESLDKLGWKKVFIDSRNELPGVEHPKSIIDRKILRRESASSNTMNDLRKRKSITSKEIASAVEVDPEAKRILWPGGHNMMVALSGGRIRTFVNKAGRPVVDHLAKELVEDIFSWTERPESPLKRPHPTNYSDKKAKRRRPNKDEMDVDNS